MIFQKADLLVHSQRFEIRLIPPLFSLELVNERMDEPLEHSAKIYKRTDALTVSGQSYGFVKLAPVISPQDGAILLAGFINCDVCKRGVLSDFRDRHLFDEEIISNFVKFISSACDRHVVERVP